MNDDRYDERVTEIVDDAFALGYRLAFKRDAHGWQAIAFCRGGGPQPSVAARTRQDAAELALAAIRSPRRLAA